MNIIFNKPFFTGKELDNIKDAIVHGKISGNGEYTKKCHEFFQKHYGFRKCLLTTSCTDALEMAAILCDIKPGDEVIVPSYTFVSSANAFALRGAKIVFIDSHRDRPGMDETKIEEVITSRTKVIVPVHYAGIACDMDKIMEIARKNNLFVVEDSAQAIDSFYNGKPLGSIGHFGCFSFHETKNIQCGEGGMLVVNDERFSKRAEIIWEKGTNRAEFYRGEVNKYGWVDIGSSFLLADILASFLYAQLEQLDVLQKKRKNIWERYYQKLKILEENKLISLPIIPEFATNNAHMFYIICRSLHERQSLISYLRESKIEAVFHYLSLHNSPYYQLRHDQRSLVNCRLFEDCLVRLPFHFELKERDVDYVSERIIKFFSR